MGKTLKRLMKKVSLETRENMNAKKDEEEKEQENDDSLPSSLSAMIAEVKKCLGPSDDLVIRELVLNEGKKAAIFFTDGLTNTAVIQELIEHLLQSSPKEAETNHLLQFYRERMIAIGELKEIDRFHDFCFNLLTGETLFFIDGENRALSFGTKDWERRAIEEPTTQTVVRGPKDAFTENIRTNTALVRRRIKSPHLWSERFIIGKQTNTPVVIMYMNNIARQDLIEEVRARLNKINVDSILESGMIEELIEDEPFSIVPTTYITERPDTVAAGLLEGRVAILVDGTPFAIIVPTVFSQFFQVSEDYYDRFTVATFIRIIRFLSLFVSTGLLPLYISLITFHHEALPTPFLNNLAEQRERVPFPALLEAIFLMFSFEVLREAGVRMPRVIGPAISIVGGLVLGQAAVEAGFVSASVVILVAMVALTDFIVPVSAMADAVKIYRYALLFLAASFGMYGIAIGTVLIVLQLCSLRSFGIPYLAPFAPFIYADFRDIIIRFPKWAKDTRPSLISSDKNKIRERTDMPSPKRNDRWKRMKKG